MKVDCYRSQSRPAFAFIVFADTDLGVLDDDAQQILESLAPVILEHQAIDLGVLILNEEKDKLLAEVERLGYGLMMFSPEVFERAIREASTKKKIDENAID